MDAVIGYIGKCIDDVVPRITVRTFPNQKPWVNGEVRAKLKAWTDAYNSGDLEEYRKSRYALRRAISSAKRQYRDKVESHYKGSNTRSMWAGLKTLTDYKKKISSAEDNNLHLNVSKTKELIVDFRKGAERGTRPPLHQRDYGGESQQLQAAEAQHGLKDTLQLLQVHPSREDPDWLHHRLAPVLPGVPPLAPTHLPTSSTPLGVHSTTSEDFRKMQRTLETLSEKVEQLQLEMQRKQRDTPHG
ncbi:hypothetical protein L3Q82_001120 [Scortum barcoo]|uniref:Uncharacterized protein n=1 Tax=Scortum barcoo TaxID=214431 RepID=A0ACB8WB59_9TELE|nr:hypothetical protein L3Q82_001120 [Scortum barcoo]